MNSSSQLQSLAFVKMQGIGNHFVVLDGLRSTVRIDFDFAEAAITLCQHHFGVGADGLLLLDKPEESAQRAGAKVRMRMWNPDGSEDMCGNGLRCIVRLAHQRGYVGREFVTQTLAGLRHCEVLPDGLIRVEMGQPVFDFDAIPFAPLPGLARPIEYTLPLGDVQLPHVTTLSTGSTHTVIFVDELPDDDTFLRLSPQIEHHPWFPERTSVMWAQVLDDENVRLRIWERGVQEATGTTGETLACGTGACATAVAAQITERTRERVGVQSRGGTLRIEWQRGHEILMTGPAEIVYEGLW